VTGTQPHSTTMSVAEMAGLAALGDDFAPRRGTPAADTPDTVLLTGATGFVGAFLLAELLQRRTAEILCLVRADDQPHASRRLLASQNAYGLHTAAHHSRITPVIGDLAQPGLGLTEREFAALHNRVGSIIHCGAAVNWTSQFDELAAANIGGTKEILRLALSGNPPRPLHHISTVGVFSSSQSTADVVFEDTLLDDSGPLNMGYAQTKWIAEKMVRTAHARGLPVTIHRINTGGHSHTGQFNRLDYLSLLIKACVQAGIAPDRLNMPVQPAPIDYVAHALETLSADTRSRGRTFHLANSHAMTWPWLFACIRSYGYPLTVLPYETWLASITTTGTASAIRGLTPFLRHAIDRYRLPISDSKLTQDALRHHNLHCPPLTPALIRTYLDRFISTGYLPPP
jgi:thioester reductase-like protein